MKFFDLHCDTIAELYSKKADLYRNNLHISLEKGSILKQWCQCFAVFIHPKYQGAEAVEYFSSCYDNFQKQLKLYDQYIKQIDVPNEQEGVQALLTVENGSVLAGELERISWLKQLGVKAISLTWNAPNEIASGNDHPEMGITDFGVAAVAEMERQGIIVDCSHLNDKGFEQLTGIVKRPIIATHSNSRTLCPHKRNLTDDQFRFIVSTGGIVGINFYPLFLSTDPDNADLHDLIRHIDRFIELGGEDHIALGSDFDGASMPKGLSDLSELSHLRDAMIQHGYTDRIIDKIFWDNAYHFWTSHKGETVCATSAHATTQPA